MMLGVYFSGTGNTKYCVETFVKHADSSAESVSIENPVVIEKINANDTIVFGYPVYFSNLPKMVGDFIVNNGDTFYGKKIYIIATMAMFSGDGAGCSARLFEKVSATILGGLHLQMPDSIADSVFLKTTDEKNQKIIKKTKQKITTAVSRLKEGNPHQDGLGMLSRISGLLVQRLWFQSFSTSYQEKPDIDQSKCIGCGICSKICPMKNITVDKKAISGNHCTLCYRCVNQCPEKALTILGKKVYNQYRFPKNLS